MRDPRPCHVLVIDGAEEVADLMRDVLEEEGYLVSVAPEAPAPLSNITREDVDLVIVDPVSDGENPGEWVQRGIDRDFDAVDVPVVVCTGHPRVLHDLADDLTMRNIDVVPKPFDLDALLQVVEDRCDPSSMTPSSDRESGATP